MTEENSDPEIPLSERLRGIPGIFGIRLREGPIYNVLQSDGNIEIRQYRTFTLASVTINGNFEEARRTAFFCLANYIFGKNKDKKQLKMISPVLQEETSEFLSMTSPLLQRPTNYGWTMSFVLPQKYSVASAPTPRDKRISLHKYPARIVATLRYSGINDQEKIKKHSGELMQWLSKNYSYSPIGEIQSAQYDGPSTIPFLRKNEIHVEVAPLQ